MTHDSLLVETSTTIGTLHQSAHISKLPWLCLLIHRCCLLIWLLSLAIAIAILVVVLRLIVLVLRLVGLVVLFLPFYWRLFLLGLWRRCLIWIFVLSWTIDHFLTLLLGSTALVEGIIRLKIIATSLRLLGINVFLLLVVGGLFGSDIPLRNFSAFWHVLRIICVWQWSLSSLTGYSIQHYWIYSIHRLVATVGLEWFSVILILGSLLSIVCGIKVILVRKVTPRWFRHMFVLLLLLFLCVLTSIASALWLSLATRVRVKCCVSCLLFSWRESHFK